MRSSLARALTGTALTVGMLAAGATGAAAHETYTVQPGDTLSSIARSVDAVSSWQELHELNADTVPDPHLISIDQELSLTSSGPVTSANSEPAPASTSGTPMSTWDRLAECESSGDWSINTGNGYYGGLQFAQSSWEWVGGSGMPHQASKSEQIARAEILLDRQGWGAWPACSLKLGLR